jgi:hypothetical protein
MATRVGLVFNFVGALLLSTAAFHDGYRLGLYAAGEWYLLLCGFTLLAAGFAVQLIAHREAPSPSGIAEALGPASEIAGRGPEGVIAQYGVLAEFARFEHTRWTDNHRIFLTIAAVALAAEGVLIRASSPTTAIAPEGALVPASVLSDAFYLLAVAVLGAVVACVSEAFVERPNGAANVWYKRLRELEEVYPSVLVPAFTRSNIELRGGAVSLGHRGALTARAVLMMRLFLVVQLVLAAVAIARMMGLRL